MTRTTTAALGLASFLGFLGFIGCTADTPSGPSAIGPTITESSPAQPPASGSGSTPYPASAHAHHGSSAAGAGVALSAEANQQIAQLRRLIAPFHNFDKAVEAGYSVAAPGPGVCISDPARGGMGFHYTLANKDLINDGVVSLLEPEFIVYSPQRNGGVRLSAVDYFVPYTSWPHADPPSLLGVPFAREDAFQAYVLHIWAFWPNPAGIFANFNPDVPLCP